MCGHWSFETRASGGGRTTRSVEARRRERSYAYGEREAMRMERGSRGERKQDREREAMREAMRERTYECKQDREREAMRRKQDGGGGGKRSVSSILRVPCVCLACIPSKASLFLCFWCSSSCFTGVTLVAKAAERHVLERLCLCEVQPLYWRYLALLSLL